jgi:acetyl-CoA carboxylase biotin carboxylase subunit
MRRALYEYKITGVKTSIKFLERIMESEDFRSGKYNTHFIEKNQKFLLANTECDMYCEDLALIATYIDHKHKLEKVRLTISKATVHHGSDWKQFGRRQAAYRL